MRRNLEKVAFVSFFIFMCSFLFYYMNSITSDSLTLKVAPEQSSIHSNSVPKENYFEKAVSAHGKKKIINFVNYTENNLDQDANETSDADITQPNNSTLIEEINRTQPNVSDVVSVKTNGSIVVLNYSSRRLGYEPPSTNKTKMFNYIKNYRKQLIEKLRFGLDILENVKIGRFATKEDYMRIKNKIYPRKDYFIRCLPTIPDMTDHPHLTPKKKLCKRNPVLTINKFGRLGNNVCQYMALLIMHMKFKANIAVQFEMHDILKQYFNHLSIPPLTKYCYKYYNMSSTSFDYIYTDFFIQRKLAEKDHRDRFLSEEQLEHPITNMQSYPCPIDIMMEYRPLAQREFRVVPEIKSIVIDHWNDLLKNHTTSPTENCTKISVHVRLTDYVHFVNDHYHEPISTGYYERAFNYYRRNFPCVVFVVVSDDMEWCRKNFKAPDIIMAGTPEVNPIVDFIVAGLCDHHIAGYGTFSFTSAYLGNGTIVYPLPIVDAPHLFEIQLEYICSNSSDLIPIPDVPLLQEERPAALHQK